LNPTSASNGYSPYSTFSSMAGNVLFISPELLVSDGLLFEQDLAEFRNSDVDDSANYAAGESIKNILLSKAWLNFNNASDADEEHNFKTFIAEASYWLDEYALYVQLKQFHDGAPWYEWNDMYKYRDKQSMDTFANDNHDALQRIKWEQYIFHKQWAKLKKHCGNLGIKMFGDLPFYVCHDSADVWANRELFSIDDQGNIKSMAGVPPDYFNSTGQLWGMPVFDWETLKRTEYDWWIKRIKKNLEFYDLLRFDHFRAFADYWEVPAGEKTAVNGTWRKGPGDLFFATLERAIGNLPFVAEDLGDINEDVYNLRDRFKLPGMKVLQFAFAGSIATSAYSPHNFENNNFIVYTGTHDNNTTRGWFEHDLSRADRAALSTYVGHAVKEKNIHIDMIRLSYNSIAKIAIVPMQDILGLSQKSRMNSPGTASGNWTWRLQASAISLDLEKNIRDLVSYSNRF
jgi:4-alpha-glucanotransferase